MSVYIIAPLITDEMVRKVYCFLCICEVKKQIGMSPDLYEGTQDGYMMCLVHLFGQCDEKEAEQAFDEGKSYYSVIERILNEKLGELVRSLKTKDERMIFGNYDKYTIGILEIINESCRNAVDEYFTAYPEEMRASLKYL